MAEGVGLILTRRQTESTVANVLERRYPIGDGDRTSLDRGAAGERVRAADLLIAGAGFYEGKAACNLAVIKINLRPSEQQEF